MRRSTPPVYRLAAGDSAQPPPTFRGGIVAIGSFDGVHLGHKALIAKAAALATEHQTKPLVLTFEPHPRRFFQPDQPMFMLSTPEIRRALLGIAGAAGVIEAVFDAELAALDATAFVERILVERLAVRGVVVGDAFRFGKGRGGDISLLHALGEAHGFVVAPVATVTDRFGETVSSGRVRDALRAGAIDHAASLLGHRWFVTGTVVGGDKRGRELGFPTANLEVPQAMELRYGIYAVTAHWADGRTANGVASFGVRPVFGGKQPLLEVHLFDFEGDLYGADMAVVFEGWLRPELNFPSIEALIAQMNLDAAEARDLLQRRGSGSTVDRALTDWF